MAVYCASSSALNPSGYDKMIAAKLLIGAILYQSLVADYECKQLAILG